MSVTLPHDTVEDGRRLPNLMCPQCLERTGVYIGRSKQRNIYQCHNRIQPGGVWRDCNAIFFSNPMTTTYKRPMK